MHLDTRLPIGLSVVVDVRKKQLEEHMGVCCPAMAGASYTFGYALMLGQRSPYVHETAGRQCPGQQQLHTLCSAAVVTM
jgi:hypothetical protein